MARGVRKGDLIGLVRSTIRDHEMIARGDGLVVAVSGGPDSVALLHVLHLLRSEWDCWLVVAHVDHCLRPESREDSEFVRRLATGLGLEARIKTVDVRAAASDMGVSIEEAGRRVRYEFLEQVRAAKGAATVATAHQRDDETETFFLRLFRGTTVAGLGGIPPVRGRVIRPLIRASREEILDFLRERGVPYRLDRSNLGVSTDRNFVRNRLFPVIRGRFADFERPLHRTLEMVRREEKVLSELSAELYSRSVRAQGNELIVSVPALREANSALAGRVLLDALYALTGPEMRLSSIHIGAILRIINGNNPSAAAHLPGGLVVLREYDQIRLSTKHWEEFEPFSIRVSGPGAVEVPLCRMGLDFQIIDVQGDQPFFPAGHATAHFDADTISFPVELRSTLPGDRFRPWGMAGTRKIKKVLIDHKVPARLRRKLPLLVREAEILWIPGIRRGQAGAVGPETRRVLVVNVVDWGEFLSLRGDSPSTC